METINDNSLGGETQGGQEPQQSEAGHSSESVANDSNAGYSASQASPNGHAQNQAPVTDYEKRFKDASADITRRAQAAKALEQKFGRYGGFDKALAFLEKISQDKEFHEFVQSRRAGTQNMSDSDKKALDLVRSIVRQEYEQKIRGFQNQFKPIFEAQIESHKNAVYSQLDKDMGWWRKYQPQVDQMLSGLPQAQKLTVTPEMVSRLVGMVAVKDLGTLGASVYEQNLKNKKTLSPETPTQAPKGGSPRPTSIGDAFRQAKRELGG